MAWPTARCVLPRGEKNGVSVLSAHAKETKTGIGSKQKWNKYFPEMLVFILFLFWWFFYGLHRTLHEPWKVSSLAFFASFTPFVETNLSPCWRVRFSPLLEKSERGLELRRFFSSKNQLACLFTCAIPLRPMVSSILRFDMMIHRSCRWNRNDGFRGRAGSSRKKRLEVPWLQKMPGWSSVVVLWA